MRPNGLQPPRLLCSWDFPGKNTGMGCHFLLQGIFPDPGIQPRSPALASRFFCTEPPGKYHIYLYNYQHTQDMELFHHTQAGFFYSILQGFISQSAAPFQSGVSRRPLRLQKKEKRKPFVFICVQDAGSNSTGSVVTVSGVCPGSDPE